MDGKIPFAIVSKGIPLFPPFFYRETLRALGLVNDVQISVATRLINEELPSDPCAERYAWFLLFSKVVKDGIRDVTSCLRDVIEEAKKGERPEFEEDGTIGIDDIIEKLKERFGERFINSELITSLPTKVSAKAFEETLRYTSSISRNVDDNDILRSIFLTKLRKENEKRN